MQKLLIFLIGAAGYGIIEILWRGYTHWSMLIVGGIAFSLIYYLFDKLEEKSSAEKALLGGGIITVVELISGTILNIVFSLNVWDYSDMPYNFYGQVCLLYSILWILLSFPLIYFCKWLENILNSKTAKKMV